VNSNKLFKNPELGYLFSLLLNETRNQMMKMKNHFEVN